MSTASARSTVPSQLVSPARNSEGDYLADMGFGIGEITDIDLFLETSYSKGEACIQNYDISVENMPEIAPDEYEDAEAPISVKNYEYGVRTGYYYGTSGFGDEGIMEVQKPSLFKAEWSSQRSVFCTDVVAAAVVDSAFVV